jgi:hypothetical protein
MVIFSTISNSLFKKASVAPGCILSPRLFIA